MRADDCLAESRGGSLCPDPNMNCLPVCYWHAGRDINAGTSDTVVAVSWMLTPETTTMFGAVQPNVVAAKDEAGDIFQIVHGWARSTGAGGQTREVSFECFVGPGSPPTFTASVPNDHIGDQHDFVNLKMVATPNHMNFFSKVPGGNWIAMESATGPGCSRNSASTSITPDVVFYELKIEPPGTYDDYNQVAKGHTLIAVALAEGGAALPMGASYCGYGAGTPGYTLANAGDFWNSPGNNNVVAHMGDDYDGNPGVNQCPD